MAGTSPTPERWQRCRGFARPYSLACSCHLAAPCRSPASVLSCHLSTKTGALTHVSIQLDAGGHNLVQPKTDDKEKTRPINRCPAVFRPRWHTTSDGSRSGSDAAPGTALAMRYYDEAEAVIKVDESGRTPQLSDDRRLIVLEQAQQRPAFVLSRRRRCRANSSTSSTSSAIPFDRSPAADQTGRRGRFVGQRRDRDGTSADARHRRRVRGAKRPRWVQREFRQDPAGRRRSRHRRWRRHRSRKFAASICSIGGCTASRD